MTIRNLLLDLVGNPIIEIGIAPDRIIFGAKTVPFISCEILNKQVKHWYVDVQNNKIIIIAQD